MGLTIGFAAVPFRHDRDFDDLWKSGAYMRLPVRGVVLLHERRRRKLFDLSRAERQWLDRETRGMVSVLMEESAVRLLHPRSKLISRLRATLNRLSVPQTDESAWKLNAKTRMTAVLECAEAFQKKHGTRAAIYCY